MTTGARPSLVALIVATVSFAGCIGGFDESEDSSLEGPQTSFSNETGAIVGQVYDDESRPIEAATVGILKPSLETKTDAEGRFSLNNVPPGDYVVHAISLYHHPAALRATVVAGDSTEPLIYFLEQKPLDVPYHKTSTTRVELTGAMWKATPECVYSGVHTLVKTCGGIRFACGDPDLCEQHTADNEFFTDEWQTIIGEVTWQPQSGATGKGFHFDLNAPNITRGPGGSIDQSSPYTFHLSSGEPPIQVRVDKADLEARGIAPSDWNNYPENDCTAPTDEGPDAPNCDWFWRLFPAACDAGFCEDEFGPDYGLSYQNPVEVHFTFFIKEPAPAGWTALPDA